LCIGITPYIFIVADLERGYNATGGEVFIPLLPLFVWMLKDSFKEIKLTLKGVVSNDQM
jgi:hypothetical protein